MLKVKIKTWNQMEDEFGLIQFGAINCKYNFTEPMEKNLPKNRIIYLDEDFNLDDFAIFSHDMIKEYFIIENIWNNLGVKEKCLKLR